MTDQTYIKAIDRFLAAPDVHYYAKDILRTLLVKDRVDTLKAVETILRLLHEQWTEDMRKELGRDETDLDDSCVRLIIGDDGSVRYTENGGE